MVVRKGIKHFVECAVPFACVNTIELNNEMSSGYGSERNVLSVLFELFEAIHSVCESIIFVQTQ